MCAAQVRCWRIGAGSIAAVSRRFCPCQAVGQAAIALDLLDGQYKNPIGLFGFNPAEGWSRDVSHDVARELRLRCDLQMRDVPSSLLDFVERHGGSSRQLTLRLVSK
jgi:hypothetical protein